MINNISNAGSIPYSCYCLLTNLTVWHLAKFFIRNLNCFCAKLLVFFFSKYIPNSSLKCSETSNLGQIPSHHSKHHICSISFDIIWPNDSCADVSLIGFNSNTPPSKILMPIKTKYKGTSLLKKELYNPKPSRLQEGAQDLYKLML